LTQEVKLRDNTLEAGVREFVDRVTAAYAAYGNDPVRSVTERRAIAEAVRRPWREGGPDMASIEEHVLDGLRVRIYRPVSCWASPAMLYIHGGGWVLFSIDTHDRLMREYAARAGIAVIGVDYRLAPEHRFPAALEDCATVFAWMREHSDSLGLDATRLMVGGDSAGANLSAALCLKLRDAGAPLPTAMLLNYGAYSPDHTPSYARFGSGEYLLASDEMDDFWHAYVGTPELLAQPLVAPLGADLHGLPSAFIAIAECDILADGNIAFGVRLAEAGVQVLSRTYHGAVHSFLEAVSVSPLADAALGEQADWMRRALGWSGHNELAL
jgi:acetyl esterase